ncbi:hypothetical protein [Actinomadura opuntiae]|uniref:hypothetical protein n=1 Tax=Actinomadura sp. OS1-43 TaxID=604315 RepID=UPI00255AE0B2|nr:hypothetical protein [Actinomadura sp. OS1-43]MDL4819762.1 hypothetical protein [Actinomadura sp. OS1-43]
MQLALAFSLAAVALACLLAFLFPRRTTPARTTGEETGGAREDPGRGGRVR